MVEFDMFVFPHVIVDEPDWELTCVGHWDEDWNSYMITWDPEDATSAFRCWVRQNHDVIHSGQVLYLFFNY